MINRALWELRQAWLFVVWQLFRFRWWVIKGCVEILLPGHWETTKDIIDELTALRKENRLLCWELEGALDTIVGALAEIKELKKRKRRKK
jgi:hypothetical protein